MQVFRGAVIPSVTGRSRSPPPPAPRAGEPHSFQFPAALMRRLQGEAGGHHRTTAPIRVQGVGGGDIKFELRAAQDAVYVESAFQSRACTRIRKP
jgi:hypothetical protein